MRFAAASVRFISRLRSIPANAASIENINYADQGRTFFP